MKSYNFGRVQMMVGGFRIQGFGDDGGISFEAAQDQITASTGADGEATISRSNDLSGTLTITLKETSGSNQVLEDFLTLQRFGTGITYNVPVLMEDVSTGEFVTSLQSAVMGWPTRTKTREASEREWKLYLPRFESGSSTDIPLFSL